MIVTTRYPYQRLSAEQRLPVSMTIDEKTEYVDLVIEKVEDQAGRKMVQGYFTLRELQYNFQGHFNPSSPYALRVVGSITIADIT
jgi:3-hydroxymyristoyl/3-hydroxydecanoyl-(acyl carrier protein) dehydratase